VPPETSSSRRVARLRQELWVRAAIAVIILAFNEVLGGEAGEPVVRALALSGLAVNAVYWAVARHSGGTRLQAYVRMLVDVLLLTLGLFAAGGLAAAHDLSVYMVIPVYVGIVLSSSACLLASAVATASYLAIALAQQLGWLPMTRVPPPNAWAIAAFNLLILNIVGGLTAYLAEVYRRSRRQIGALNVELERAHDALLNLNAEMQRASRLQVLGEVVAGVAHEIRNAQQITTGYLHLAQKRAATVSPDIARYLDRVADGCEATMRIANNALSVARHSSIGRAPTALGDIATRVTELKRYDLHRDGIAVRLDVSATPVVLAVGFQLEQVVLNLLTNAQDALRDRPEPRRIVVAVFAERDAAVLEVRDNGHGIASEDLPRLFEPFYTTKPTGTGLGLAIASGILRDCGGELTATSPPEGGAVFRLTLPSLEAAAPSVAAPALAEAR
jgi:signal transduction histidine kinase